MSSLQMDLSGYVRYIHSEMKKGHQAATIIEMYEGYIEKRIGHAIGFGRHINGRYQMSIVGYFNGVKLNGKAIIFLNNKLLYQGVWHNGLPGDKPTEPSIIKDLST